MPSCYVQIWRTGISTDTFRATEMCARKADGLVKGPFLSFALWKFKLTEFQSVVFWKSWVFKKTGLAETSGSYRISGSVNPCYESLPFSEIRSRFARFEQAETQKRMTVPLPSNPACKPLKKVCCGDDNFRISLETIFLENIQKTLSQKKKIRKVSEDFDTTWKTSPLPYAVLLHSKKTGGKKSLHRTRSRRWCHAGLGF